MLRNVKRVRAGKKAATPPNEGRYGIIASLYNTRFVDSMLKAAVKELKRAHAGSIKIYRVPGAFEIPTVASALAQRGEFDALICLGVILRGATTHAQHIGEAATQALMDIQVKHALPVIHEVLLLENEQQAVERCLNAKTNRGTEAASTAVSMVRLMKTLR